MKHGGMFALFRFQRRTAMLSCSGFLCCFLTVLKDFMICKFCNSTLIGNKGKQFCNSRCRQQLAYSNRQSYFCFCDECGGIFVSKYETSHLCSRKCVSSKRSKDFYILHPERRNGMGFDRRGKTFMQAAKHYGVKYEHVKRQDVFEQENWTCHICKLPIDKTIKYPNPMYPTLDHLIPISKGGDHVRGNIKAAHKLCNEVKHDRL